MLRARETMHLPGDRTITKGDLVEDGDEAVKGREDLFEAVADPEPKPSRTPRRGGQTKKDT